MGKLLVFIMAIVVIVIGIYVGFPRIRRRLISLTKEGIIRFNKARLYADETLGERDAPVEVDSDNQAA